MSDDNNIRNYTAADIEKYWTGKLSATEMHALEKAAMDDPFLADALEGYRETKTAASDVALLKQKLDKKTGGNARVIPFQTKKYTWLKVAAAIVIIAGVGVLIQQLISSNSNSTIALEKTDRNKSSVSDNNAPSTPEADKDFSGTLKDTLSVGATQEGKNKITETTLQSLPDTLKSDGKSAAQLDVAAAANAPVVTNVEQRESEQLKPSYRRDAVSGKPNPALKQEITDSSRKLQDNYANAAKAQTRQAFYEADKSAGLLLNNAFNYRVVDAQNNPVPFANVMNTRDNIGTYTDMSGRFNLVSNDSILDVQIKSLGFTPNHYRISPTKKSGDLVLKEDSYTRQQILDSNNRKVVASRSRKDTTELEEPEVGWSYYNTYVANNLQLPDNIRGKNDLKDVELSFDIDKNGHPVNIKVTKSSQCKECDAEAVRLLREGPKWRKKGKKSKTSISIAVDQK